MNAQSGRLRTWGQVLHSVTLHGSKTCDTDAGGCGRFCPVQSFVYVPAPWAFVVRLAWERQREPPDAIRGTLAAIQEVRPARCAGAISKFWVSRSAKECCSC